MPDILFKHEPYKIIGICMEVHRELGMGFEEAVYKDALQREFEANGIYLDSEKQFKFKYKGITLTP